MLLIKVSSLSSSGYLGHIRSGRKGVVELVYVCSESFRLEISNFLEFANPLNDFVLDARLYIPVTVFTQVLQVELPLFDLLSYRVEQVFQLLVLLALNRRLRLRLPLHHLEKLWICAILLFVVSQSSLSDTTFETNPSPVYIRYLCGGLAGKLSGSPLICLVLVVLLSVLELESLLQILFHGTSVHSDSTRSLAHFLVHLYGHLALNNFASLASRDKVDRVVLELFPRHLWVLDHGFLRAWTRLFHFFRPRLRLDRWVVHLWLLFARTIHAIEHLANFVITPKVLVQILVVDIGSIVEVFLSVWSIPRGLSSIRHYLLNKFTKMQSLAQSRLAFLQ